MAELVHIPTFTGDCHTGIYLGFREEQKLDKEKKPYTQYVLGMMREIPTKFGTTSEMITELTVSKDLATKGFLTLIAPMVDTQISLPIYVSTYQGSSGVTRYVTESAMQMFGQGAQPKKEQAA
ncbi:hypothetical protein EMM73_16050 [Rheinheimera sediminis]|uniref:hypothetical protein n=1 Tax=Rheinheimera sp. YQF-1 TaxID=2499626 RepID=UPI000FDBE06B|nr:hypothetical protein [Rheinheimera sp. YQF-1]RVT44644.1 hypothetical protein EMM73_16050 [Rheinheimera sp. YQF-1]